MADHIETQPANEWPMQQELRVGGVIVKDLHNYSLRWHMEGKRYLPDLYFEGKRVTKPWQLLIAVNVMEDTKDASANTA